MATFLIDIPERKNNVRRGNTKHETTVYAEQEDEAKENNSGKSELEKRYQEIIVTVKKAAAKKRKEAHDTRIDVKIPQQLQEQKALLLKTQNKSLKVKA